MFYFNFSYGQALKVNWAYTSNQREDTSGYFRLPFFFTLLIDFVAFWVPFINISYVFTFNVLLKSSGHFNIFVGDLSPEVTDATLFACFSVYPSCSWVFHYLQYFPFIISLSRVGIRQGWHVLDFLMTVPYSCYWQHVQDKKFLGNIQMLLLSCWILCPPWAWFGAL